MTRTAATCRICPVMAPSSGDFNLLLAGSSPRSRSGATETARPLASFAALRGPEHEAAAVSMTLTYARPGVAFELRRHAPGFAAVLLSLSIVMQLHFLLHAGYEEAAAALARRSTSSAIRAGSRFSPALHAQGL